MIDIFLQLWGGGFYLINKILFSFSESKNHNIKNTFKQYAWSAYIIGAPAWIILLIDKNDWIAASIELGGIPAMLLGLYKTCYKVQANQNIENTVKYITYSVILLGLVLSFQHYGGINSLSQFLELGASIGFLMGTYLMSQNNFKGYLYFMLMNINMALLMGLQDKYILMTQQFISLLFVIYGYIQSSKIKS